MNKSIATISAALLFALPIATSAYVDCRETVNGCTLTQLIEISRQTHLTASDRASALLQAVTILQKQLTEAQTNASASAPPAKCVNLTHALVIGSTDAKTNREVSRLQNFLKQNGYFTGSITGYYGSLTAEAVVRYQKAKGMDFVTTKSGVGPMTRSKMMCTNVSTSPVEKVSWIIEPANPSITDENDYKKYEQKISIDVTRSDKSTQRYVAGTSYGCGVWKDAPAMQGSRTVLGAVTCYMAASGSSFLALIENGHFFVEFNKEDASGKTAGTTTRVLEL